MPLWQGFCSSQPNLCLCGKGSVHVSRAYAVVVRAVFKSAEPMPLWQGLCSSLSCMTLLCNLCCRKIQASRTFRNLHCLLVSCRGARIPDATVAEPGAHRKCVACQCFRACWSGQVLGESVHPCVWILPVLHARQGGLPMSGQSFWYAHLSSNDGRRGEGASERYSGRVSILLV